MQLTVFQVDAFTNHLFGGNPAAVVPLKKWLPDDVLQQLAAENNLSETVFFVPDETRNTDYLIRWFTPVVEVNLCGHATLAAAWVLFNRFNHPQNTVLFSSKSGVLTIRKNEDGIIAMDFPSWLPKPISVPLYLKEVLQLDVIQSVHQHRDLLVVLENEEAVKNCTPDFTLMKKYFDKIIITAKGRDADFVSRFFAPASGIDEDPVTGSAHAQLIPYWTKVLNKDTCFARQVSARGGEIWCKQLSDTRVEIAGHCVFYMQGEFELP